MDYTAANEPKNNKQIARCVPPVPIMSSSTSQNPRLVSGIFCPRMCSSAPLVLLCGQGPRPVPPLRGGRTPGDGRGRRSLRGCGSEVGPEPCQPKASARRAHGPPTPNAPGEKPASARLQGNICARSCWLKVFSVSRRLTW